MGLFNILDPVLDFVFSPVLKLDPLTGILIVSFFVALFITLIYKYVTDQVLMKELKDKQKGFKKKLSEAKDDPHKVAKMQKEQMAHSMELMKHSFKPMFYTIIPIIIVFGWLNMNFGSFPIMPGEEFSTTILFNSKAVGSVLLSVPDDIILLSDADQTINEREAQWKLKGPTGEYVLFYESNSEKYSKNLKISSRRDVAPPIKRKKGIFDYIYSSSDGFLPRGSSAFQITIDHRKIQPLKFIGIPWVKGFGWLGTYIIFSIIFSIVLRKILKVH